MSTKKWTRLTLSHWILISMIIGVLVGVAWPQTAESFKVLSTIFMHLIKLIIVPLIFSTLVVGIAAHSDDMKAVGKLAVKSLIYFEVVTTLALLAGLLVVNWVQPGRGIQLPVSATDLNPAVANAQAASSHLKFSEVIEHVFPSSFFDAASRNDVLQVVVFAILFGIGLAQVRGEHKKTLLSFCHGISETMFNFTKTVMLFAPFGIGGAMAYTVGSHGLGVLLGLGKLVLSLYGALILFVVAVFIPVMWAARIPLRSFFKAVQEPALIAFSTASSEAALPDAIQRMEKFGVPGRIVAFVLPTGYSFNLDGTTLYLALASVFIAQAAGIELSFNQQLLMMLTLMLTSKGVAAVPRASLVILSATVSRFGLPIEGVALILGVDAFMDMARTSVNLIGNCLASAVIARWEGELDDRQAALISPD
jgi:proton glutamate symport protein